MWLDGPRHHRRRWCSACATALVAWLASACHSPSQPSLVQTPTPTPTPTPTSAPSFKMSGRVWDENGVPLSGALVAVDYASAGGVSNPPSHCPQSAQFCWLATNTNSAGEYSVEFSPRPWTGHGLGYVYSFLDGYEGDVQWVPTGPSPSIRDLHLPQTHRIIPGESIVVSVEPTSSLCTDLEDLWVLDSRCETVVIESGAGTLAVDARPMSGGPAPSIFWYTTGNYDGFISRPAPGSVSIPVRPGTYRILVAIPDGSPSQQFRVTTSLR